MGRMFRDGETDAQGRPLPSVWSSWMLAKLQSSDERLSPAMLQPEYGPIADAVYDDPRALDPLSHTARLAIEGMQSKEMRAVALTSANVYSFYDFATGTEHPIRTKHAYELAFLPVHVAAGVVPLLSPVMPLVHLVASSHGNARRRAHVERTHAAHAFCSFSDPPRLPSARPRLRLRPRPRPRPRPRLHPPLPCLAHAPSSNAQCVQRRHRW